MKEARSGWGGRDCSGVKSTGCSAKDLGRGSDSPGWSLTPGPKGPSFILFRHCMHACTWCTYMHVDKTLIHLRIIVLVVIDH